MSARARGTREDELTTPSRLLYAVTIFASGFLLFIVQPLIARQILPWFGGSAGVWTTCLMFFQLVLVAGYAYSNWTTRRLSPRAQAGLHIGLLVASVMSLPIVASPGWKPAGEGEPTWRILGLLLATIGLPYFVLCTTGPLVQAWFARAFPDRKVYRLFALSNLAALAALASYPFAIEPWMTTTRQAQLWSAAYGIFMLLCIGAAAPGLWRQPPDIPGSPAPADEQLEATPEMALPRPAWRAIASGWRCRRWAPGCCSRVTNHITQNIASIPFLWMLPLTLYLATFIICFDHERWYHRGVWVAPALVMLAVAAYGLQTEDVTLNVKIAVPLYAGGLFAWCIFCHGELARRKPASRDLTTYYLMIAAGGALGGLAVGLVAPRILVSSYELGIGLTLTALLAVIALRRLFVLVPLAALGIAITCGYYSYRQIEIQRASARVLERNFYGTLRTEDTGSPDDASSKRQLINGVILHGEQFLSPARRRDPTSYYGPTSGIGLALAVMDRPGRRVGVIGLGTGSLAAYRPDRRHVSLLRHQPAGRDDRAYRVHVSARQPRDDRRHAGRRAPHARARAVAGLRRAGHRRVLERLHPDPSADDRGHERLLEAHAARWRDGVSRLESILRPAAGGQGDRRGARPVVGAARRQPGRRGDVEDQTGCS